MFLLLLISIHAVQTVACISYVSCDASVACVANERHPLRVAGDARDTCKDTLETGLKAARRDAIAKLKNKIFLGLRISAADEPNAVSFRFAVGRLFNAV